MCVYMQFPGNKSVTLIKFSNAFQRSLPPPKKNLKAHCLKLNLSSALKIVLPLLLSPVESVSLLKLHKSQHWDTFPLLLPNHPHPPFCNTFILSASLPSSNFLLHLFIC